MRSTSLFGALPRALKERPWQAAATIFSAAGTVVAGVGLLAASGYLITAAAYRPPILDLLLLFVAVRFFGISRAALRYLERFLSHDHIFRLLLGLRLHFYERLLSFGPARLQRERSGDLLRRAVGDIETLQEVYLRLVLPVLTAMIITTATVCWLGFYDRTIALGVAAIFLLQGFGLPLLSHHFGRADAAKAQEDLAALNEGLVELVQGSAEILVSAQEERFLEKLHHKNHHLSLLQRRQARRTASQQAIWRVLVDLAAWATFLWTIPLLHAGEIAGPHVALLVLGVLASFEALEPLGKAFQFLERSRRAQRRLDEIVQVAPPDDEEHAKKDLLTAAEGAPSLTIKELWFRYDGQREWALNDINLELHAGESLAIVGLSGAGKTTLLNLLCGFYQPQKGSILIDDQDLAELNLADHRRRLSVVSQTSHLFNTSLRQNLLLAKPRATDEELFKALADAHLDGLVSDLPDGMETIVGDLGARLSGGERQRLSLARAYLKGAPLLILDEPTANLDGRTERAIFDRLHRLRKGRTTILITHRFIDLDTFDHVLLLHNGAVAGHGAHHRLLKASPLYRQLFEQHHRFLSTR